tara:strand:+ start:12942 stop:14114 length:1173 start_codon:yes stop_codon:yes gene_type:complete
MSIKYYNTKPLWELEKTDNNLFKKLLSKDNDILKTLETYDLKNRIPFFEDLNVFESNKYIRPKGSSRAFYIKLRSGGVLAIKGSEVLSNQIETKMKEDAKTQIGSRPWTLYENFIYREQKTPLALHFNEGEEDQFKALNFQKKMLNNFNALETAPIPLFTYKLSDSFTSNYISRIKPFLNRRAMEIIKTPLNDFGLGVIIYYYEHVPYRIQFESIDKDIPIIKRLENAAKDKLKPYKAYDSIDKLLLIVSKMLTSNLMPLSRQAHGIGQCIAKQNVTLLGGIADMGSIIDFSEINSESEFIQLFYSCISVLTSTIREFLTRGNSSFLYEFEDPTPLSIIISNYCLQRINFYCNNLEKTHNLKVSTFLSSCLENCNSLSRENLQNTLKKIY